MRTRPRVTLNFDGNRLGGDILVMTGRARLVEGEPPAHELPDYVAKYGEQMARVSGSREVFARAYRVVRPGSNR